MTNVNFVQVSPEYVVEIVKNAVAFEFQKFQEILQPQKTDIEYLTRKEAAKKLKVSLGTLNNWVNSGKLSSHKVGRRILFIESELEIVVNQSKKI